MSKTLFALSFLFVFSAVALGQAGRKFPVPLPPPPAPTPSPDPAAKPSKPSLPKIVDGERIFTSKEVDERVQILRKPTPVYTYEARKHQRRGYVILRAILAADNTVKHIEVLTGLPDGLTEKSIEVARQIKFKPAMKDGKPVSVWVELQYQFQLF